MAQRTRSHPSIANHCLLAFSTLPRYAERFTSGPHYIWSKGKGRILRSLSGVVGKITDKEKERNQIISYLKSHQAAYATVETPVASLLESINRDILDKNNIEDFSSDIFDLTGLSHAIIISQQKWSSNMIYRSVTILVIGIVLVLAGTVLYKLKLTGLLASAVNNAHPLLLAKGAADIIFALSALATGDNLTWADYRQHTITNPTVYLNKWKTATMDRFTTFFNRQSAQQVTTGGSTADSTKDQNVQTVDIKRVVATSIT